MSGFNSGHQMDKFFGNITDFHGNIADWFTTHPQGLLTGVPLLQGFLIIVAIYAVLIAFDWLRS
jgi:hypothetical protein